jgi:hypothetical protein
VTNHHPDFIFTAINLQCLSEQSSPISYLLDQLCPQDRQSDATLSPAYVTPTLSLERSLDLLPVKADYTSTLLVSDYLSFPITLYVNPFCARSHPSQSFTMLDHLLRVCWMYTNLVSELFVVSVPVSF